MKNKQNLQSVNKEKINFVAVSKQCNTLGVLPQIIADKKVFQEMTYNERRKFYKSIQNELSAEELLSDNMIKLLLLYPDNYLQRYVKDEDKWHLWCGVLEHCLVESITYSLQIFQNTYQFLHNKLSVAEKRKKELQKCYENYLISKN